MVEMVMRSAVARPRLALASLVEREVALVVSDAAEVRLAVAVVVA
jgi:hypothetical protein